MRDAKERWSWSISSGLLRSDSSVAFGERVDGFSYSRVGAAATEVRDAAVDVGIGGFLILREQRGSRHHHAALAIAALRNFVLDPCLLDTMQALLGESLDGDDLLADRLRHRHRTGSRRLAVHMHRTRAAKPRTAAVLCPGKIELTPKHPEER